MCGVRVMSPAAVHDLRQRNFAWFPGSGCRQLGATLISTEHPFHWRSSEMSRFLLAALALTAALSGCGWGVGSPAAHAAAKPAAGPVEAGTIHGWTGGDATLYATVGFFSPNPEIVAVR